MSPQFTALSKNTDEDFFSRWYTKISENIWKCRVQSYYSPRTPHWVQGKENNRQIVAGKECDHGPNTLTRRGWEWGEALAAGRIPVSWSKMTLQRKLGSWKRKEKKNREGTCIKRRRTKPKGKEEWVYLRTGYDASTDRGGGDDNEENTFQASQHLRACNTDNQQTHAGNQNPSVAITAWMLPHSLHLLVQPFPLQTLGCRAWLRLQDIPAIAGKCIFSFCSELISPSFLLAQDYTPFP